jgi:hypothetical protein
MAFHYYRENAPVGHLAGTFLLYARCDSHLLAEWCQISFEEFVVYSVLTA